MYIKDIKVEKKNCFHFLWVFCNIPKYSIDFLLLEDVGCETRALLIFHLWYICITKFLICSSFPLTLCLRKECLYGEEAPVLIHKYSDSRTVRIVVITHSFLPAVFLYIPHQWQRSQKNAQFSPRKAKRKNNSLLLSFMK